MKNQAGRCRHQQSGSIFVWILIMISLFGALSFTMLQGGRTGTTTLTEQQAKLAAIEIIDYARKMTDAVKGLKASGCSDIQISFENAETESEIISDTRPLLNVYQNPNAKEGCYVFRPNGGGMNYVSPPENAQDKSKLTYTTFLSREQYAFTAVNEFYEDDNKSELVLMLPQIRQEVCDQINKSLEIGENITSGALDMNEGWPFKGEYQEFGFFPATGTSSDLDGKSMACMRYNGGYTYAQGNIFYAILLRR